MPQFTGDWEVHPRAEARRMHEEQVVSRAAEIFQHDARFIGCVEYFGVKGSEFGHRKRIVGRHGPTSSQEPCTRGCRAI